MGCGKIESEQVGVSVVKRGFFRMLLCTLLVAAMVVGPMVASAESNLLMILKTTVDGGRLREGPSSAYDVVVSLAENTKVFYWGEKSAAFCKVRTANGQVGYIYEGFLAAYGMVRLDQVYYAGGTVNVYKRPSTGGSRIGALGQGEHVLVFRTEGNWAFIKTLSGRAGFVQLSELNSFT